MLIVWACLINFIVTTILVESKLLEPMRLWVVYEAHVVRDQDGNLHKVGNKHAFVWPEGTTEEEHAAAEPFLHGPWAKLAQLVTCQLCVRVWIGFAEAFAFGGPFTGHWHQFLANGLLFAAGGHLIYSAEATNEQVARKLKGVDANHQ